MGTLSSIFESKYCWIAYIALSLFAILVITSQFCIVDYVLANLTKAVFGIEVQPMLSNF